MAKFDGILPGGFSPNDVENMAMTSWGPLSHGRFGGPG